MNLAKFSLPQEPNFLEMIDGQGCGHLGQAVECIGAEDNRLGHF